LHSAYNLDALTCPDSHIVIILSLLLPSTCARGYRPIVIIIHVQVSIGRHTFVSRRQYDQIAWADSWQAAKDLMTAVFGRTMLATHSLTGGRSNATRDDAAAVTKPALDPVKISEILGG
jgi:hypothetical protein